LHGRSGLRLAEKIDLVREQLQDLKRQGFPYNLEEPENLMVQKIYPQKNKLDWMVFPCRYAAIIPYLGKRCT
jgi:hypothetical protein